MDGDARISIQVLMDGVAEAERQLDAMNNKIKDTEQVTSSAGKGGDSFFSGFLGGAAKLGMAASGIGEVVGVVSGLGGALSGVIGESNDWSNAMKQTETVIKSTGGAAGMTASQFGDLASSLSGGAGMSKFADDAVLAGENILATFTNLKGPVFEDTTKMMLDMSQAMGTDLKGSAIQLGKALNDPAQGMTALTRVGVTFTDAQKEQIQTLEKNGDIMGAQKVILNELGREFGGSAASAAQTFEGRMFTVGEKINNVKQAIGDALVPILGKLADAAGPVIDGIGSLINIFSQLAAGDGQGVLDFFNGLGGPMGLIGTFLVNLVANFQAFFASITSGGDILSSFGTLITGNLGALGNLLGGLISYVQGQLPTWLATLGQWAMSLINWIGPQIPGVLAALGGFLGSVLGWVLGTALPALVENLATWAKAFTDWLGPQLPVMWANLVAFGGQIWDWLINTGLPTLLQNLGQWGQAFVDWIGPRIGPALQALGGMLMTIGGWLIGTALPTIISKLAEWGGAFIAWVGPQIPPLLGKLGELLLSLGNWLLTTALPAIISQLAQWGSAFLNWVGTDVLPKLPGVLGGILTSIGGWVGGALGAIGSKLQEVGTAIVNGIKTGISNGWEAFKNWVMGLLSGMVDAVKNFFGIHSPSKVFASIGTYLALGMAQGIDQGWGAVHDTLHGNMSATMRGLGMSGSLPLAVSGGTSAPGTGIVGGLMEGALGGVTAPAGATVVQVYVEDATGDWIPVTARKVKVMSNALGQMRNMRTGRASA